MYINTCVYLWRVKWLPNEQPSARGFTESRYLLQNVHQVLFRNIDDKHLTDPAFSCTTFRPLAFFECIVWYFKLKFKNENKPYLLTPTLTLCVCVEKENTAIIKYSIPLIIKNKLFKMMLNKDWSRKIKTSSLAF